MKRLLLTTFVYSFFASTILAQNPVVQSTGELDYCVGKLTKSGKGVLIKYNYDFKENPQDGNFSICNEQMNVAKTVNLNFKKNSYQTWTESATVRPTGLSYAFYDIGYKYTDKGTEYYEAYNNEPHTYLNEGVNYADVTTPEQLVQKLKDLGKIYQGFGFTDFKGNMAFIEYSDSPESYYFHMYEAFGTKYPTTSFYSLIGGKIYQIYGSLNNYGQIEYSKDDLKWVRGETQNQYEIYDELDWFRYRDFDSSSDTEQSMNFTQSLFNDDDKWEYIVREAKIIPIPDENKPIYSTDANKDGTITIYRLGGEMYQWNRLVVYNEDGTECFAIASDCGVTLEKVVHLNGKDFLETYETIQGQSYTCLYEIQKATSGLRQVACVKSSRVKAENNTVIVEVDEELSGSDVIVADTAGKIVGRGHIKTGSNNARIAMPTSTPGVYLISLKRDNNILDSHKIIINK